MASMLRSAFNFELPPVSSITSSRIRSGYLRRQQARRPVAASLNSKTLLAETVPHQVLNIRIVFNQEDFFHAV
jgi:hypothetical protein